ncbi:hypothetical protein F1735_34065 [Massilia sp. CCM 8694]|uniref:Uncharacterized protein n=2 Tax=Massilia genomosp. 1 TaxID=2609280 RepID=A0ABX0N488_9BURK|nr:hypothetical protein [Massilia genomosp. 1]
MLKISANHLNKYPYIYVIPPAILETADVSLHECRTTNTAKESKYPQLVIKIGCGGEIKFIAETKGLISQGINVHALSTGSPSAASGLSFDVTVQPE